MSRPLPISLSPHVCILESPDLAEVLQGASLPPLPNILQSFSPLPQVTTRTTTLVSVPHNSFALRFSSLADVENACREDDESRAVRTIDWMTARINKRCQKWVQDMEALGAKETLRTPWWDELRRCAEGDYAPSKTEGWNHPVALILAVSTTAPNPLAAITALHARFPQFPSWVDTTYLKYTLIVHPRNSPLSDEEANALFNAAKKQFGLHTYLLPLELPPTAPFVTVPALLPRLPANPGPESPPQQHTRPAMSPGEPGAPPVLNTLKMDETDIQHTARFTREFLVMSLLPWMEKCVVEWNENFSSTRRLPSRLFSSTRRLFGSQAPTPSPTPPPPSVGQPRSSLQLSNGPPPPSQQRRLAEFATILGDMKLAVTVWEALRKEKKGGGDILPLLLSPSASISMYAQASLQSLEPSSTDYPPHVQMAALKYAARWEAGIGSTDFLSTTMEGERWLVWAANNAEEAPSALLLAQAALLSNHRRAFRRAALWYVLAANRLEKCGVKPLTKYFLKKAQDIYEIPLPKELSPSFWDSEGKSSHAKEGLEDIMSGIEHPLSRLLYTTGDVGGAVRLFLNLLRGAPAFINAGLPLQNDGSVKGGSNDKVYLDDFKVAYQYWKSTEPEAASKADLKLPFKLCVAKSSRLRFPGDSINAETEVWSSREDSWKDFCRSRGMNASITPSGKVCANDLFWVDVIMKNPLDAEVSLSNVTVVVQEKGPSEGSTISDFVEVESIKEVTLGPKSTTSIPISLRSTRPTSLLVPTVKFDFLTLLPASESLACKGRRLHDTALQRQQPTYATDVTMQVQVVPADHRLTVSFVDDQHLTLLQGENRATGLWLVNAGSHPVSEVWIVCGPDDEIWLGDGSALESPVDGSETFKSHNSLAPQEPRRITLESALQPGESLEVPITFHAESRGSHELFLLFLFREDESKPFYSTKLSREYEVRPLLDVSVSAEPSGLDTHAFTLDVEMVNVSPASSVNIRQITSISPQWTCNALSSDVFDLVAPSQSSRLLLAASPWKKASGSRETLDFVSARLNDALKGKAAESSELPPAIDVSYSHISRDGKHSSTLTNALSQFITSGRRKFVSEHISRSHPYILPSSHPFIFPLYNPAAVDLLVFWEIPSQHKSGHLNVHGITLGAGHAALDAIVEEAEGTKAKRSMYAETRKENMEVLDSIRTSEWNKEMRPLVLSYKDTTPKVHDFRSGPCHLTLEYAIRNHSLTLPAQYTLKLKPQGPSGSLLAPPYFGRLSFRGEIGPSETTTVRPKVWISRPGSYSLGNWTLETVISLPSGEGEPPRERCYSQEPSSVNDETTLVVIDSQAEQVETTVE